MDVHGTGCYTSQAAMKLYNRQNELWVMPLNVLLWLLPFWGLPNILQEPDGVLAALHIPPIPR